MKLNTAPTHIAEVSGDVSVKQFQMRSNAKSFTILSNSLYSNKIRAIVRELGTNAYDSHVAAGCPDKPFQVHLPSVIEPWFAVRDFGVGLSSSEIENIYTVYFESTKDKSNLFNGCLGLGSKSPFSYTTNFTVTSVKDGIRSLYSAFIDDTGCPAVARLFQGETTEPNGVEVKFPVNTGDFSAFAYESGIVYGIFKVRPEILGNQNFSGWYEPEIMFSNIIPGFDIIHDGNYRRAPYTTSYAVMGNVAYPIDLPSSLLSSLSELEKRLLDSCRIEFETGEIEFQPSREGLSYIPSTIAAIKQKLSTAANAFADHIERTLLEIPNKWERTFSLYRSMRRVDAVREVANTIKDRNILLPGASVSYWSATLPVQVALELAEEVSLYTHSYRRRGRSAPSISRKHELTGMMTIDITDSVVFYEEPENRKDRARVRDWMCNNNDYNSFCAVKMKPGVSFSEFVDHLGNPPITTPDEWPEYVPPVSTSRASTGFRRYYRGQSDIVSLTEQEITSGTYYYIPTINTKFQLKLLSDRYDIQNSIVEVVNAYLKAEVYGVNTKQIKRIEKLPNWINAEYAIKDFLLSNPTIVEAAYLSDLLPSKSSIAQAIEVMSEVLGDSFKDTNLYKVSVIRECYVSRLVSTLSVAQDLFPTVKTEIEELVDNTMKELNKYPLLIPTLRSGNSELIPHVVEYVSLLNSKLST